MTKLPPDLIAQNRAAKFHFELLTKLEAGLILAGPEVQSLKTQRTKLAGAFLKITKDNRVFLVNLHIPPYRFAKNQPHSARRNREVLLHKKEIQKLNRNLKTKGVTLIPLKLSLKHNLIKLTLALARGKKKFEKRALLKKKAVEREIARQLKN